MSFNLKKYLDEHGLTHRSHPLWKEMLNEERLEATIAKQQLLDAKLKALVDQKDQILMRYKSGIIGLDKYKQEIGTIPQQIRLIRAELEREEEFEDPIDSEKGEELE